MGFWKSVWQKRAKVWLYHHFKAEQVPEHREPEIIQPKKAYANIWLKSARVVNLRTGLKRFYGAVHSRVSLLPVSHTDEVEVNTVVAPKFLSNVDARRLDRVISVNHRLLGPVAHSGSDVEIEIGLFSIAEADLVAPYLGMLENISNIAGVGFLSAAMPFAAPIKDGIDAILTGGGDNILEIGLARTFKPLKTGFHLVMRVEKEKLDPSTLRLDPENWEVVGGDGKPVKDFPYMVLEIAATTEKDDWAKIPDLKQQYDLTMNAIRRGDQKEAVAGHLVFRRIALTAGELITEDAERLSRLVKEEVDRVLGAPIAQARVRKPRVKEFQQLRLYKEGDERARESGRRANA